MVKGCPKNHRFEGPGALPRFSLEHQVSQPFLLMVERKILEAFFGNTRTRQANRGSSRAHQREK